MKASTDIHLLHTSDVSRSFQLHQGNQRGHLARRDAGTETGTGLWATGLALVCAGVVIILVAHICMRRRGLSLSWIFGEYPYPEDQRARLIVLRAGAARRRFAKTTGGDCVDTEPKPCMNRGEGRTGVLACHADAPPSPGDAAPSWEGSSADMREAHGVATCSTPRSVSPANPLPRLSPSSTSSSGCGLPPSSTSSSGRARSELEGPSECIAPYSATLSVEGDPYSDDPFASSHDSEEIQSERAATPSVFTAPSARTSVAASISGTLGGMDDSGYLSDAATVSTVPPSYRTYRPSVPNLLDHPLPLPRPLPPLPGETSPPPSAYFGQQRGRASVSRATSSSMLEGSLTDSRRPRRETRRGTGLPRKSVDGGIRLDGVELPPAYGLPDAGSNELRY